MIKKLKILVVCLGLLSQVGWSQMNIAEVEQRFNELSATQAGLNEKVQVNVSGISLADFISAIALEHNLNVSVDKALGDVIVNNFYDALVKDVYVFLVKTYDLNVEFSGSIISFAARPLEPEPTVVIKPKEIKVSYKAENDFLSIDLKSDSLIEVDTAITKASAKNVIISPAAKSKRVTVYVENRPFDQVIEMLTKSNGLTKMRSEDGYYFIDLETVAPPQKNTNTRNNSRQSNNRNASQNRGTNPTMQIIKHDDETVSIVAYDESIEVMIKEVSVALGEHYFMYDVPTGNTNLDVEHITFEELLQHVLRGTEYTFKKGERFYVIGNRNTEGLRASRLIQLENRTVETVLDLIPKELVKDIEVKEFIELNGLIVSGSYLKIEELEAFIHSVDQIVPMVQIDIIIVTTSKSSSISTGINAGVANEPVATSGTVFPGLDVTLGSESVNSIIDALNGFGLVNFGLVSQNFYLSLSALESNNVIDIQSTPKLSALNGHESTITVGETQYYQQETISVTPTISGGNTQSNKIWTAVDANLTVTIKPFVSTDGYVTLDISVQQDDFTPRVAPDAPPGNSSQVFKSLVRVKDGEMILMGGLEKESKSESGTGTPLLSRIPIIKWFFSSKTKEKEKSKLHIFIKPTVTY